MQGSASLRIEMPLMMAPSCRHLLIVRGEGCPQVLRGAV